MMLESAPSIWLYVIAFPAVTLAYMIFAMAGFGAVFITAPALAQFMPVSAVVPVLSLVDCGAATINAGTLSRRIAFDELKWLIPLMVAGSFIGTQALLVIPPRPMMFGLGFFVIGYALNALFGRARTGEIGRAWIVPFGLLGGVFSGMFGSGGFIYAMYLTRRLKDKDAIRATQSMLIILSTLTRAAIFLVAGVYSDMRLLMLAAACVPAMLLGTWLGHRVTLKMSREQFLRTIYLLLLVSGGSLVVRAAAL
ncbi:MAG: sulfite exporter TauE/SafE family protein [Hyphomicrobiales bacterium]|nr:sulfite exporter TauE/SafE family protein [Hyphomicrobiales bacterium]